MKKALFISGVFILILILTGWVDKNDEVAKALWQGNRQYEAEDYEGALKSYEAGLEKSPEDKALNFNAAQTAYLLGDYEKAFEYYEKSEDSIEKFLNAGNISFMAGESTDDNEQKGQYYMQSLQIYQDGIIKFPQEVSLKYNYELVKEKVEEFKQEQESEGEENEEEDSESEESNGENSEGEESNGENSESEEGDEGNSEAGEDSEQEGQEDSGSEEKQEENSGNEGDSQSSYSEDEGETVEDQEAIERILQILENQEEQSLKNNQEVVGSGNEEKYGW